jgi:HTH-type transcriptional regulator/antitoxin HigA
MNWKILKTEEEYNKASMRLMELFHAKVNAAGFEELQLLLVLVSNYDQLRYNTLLETEKKL